MAQYLVEKPLLAVTEVRRSCSWSSGLHTSPLYRSSPSLQGFEADVWLLEPSAPSTDVLGLINVQDLNVLLLETLLCCLGRVFWVIFNALALTVHDPSTVP